MPQSSPLPAPDGTTTPSRPAPIFQLEADSPQEYYVTEATRILAMWPLLKRKLVHDLRCYRRPTVRAMSQLFPQSLYPMNPNARPNKVRSSVVVPDPMSSPSEQDI
jgi:hypothetical protein